MTKEKLSGSEQVSQFISESLHPLKEVMQAIREVILGTDTTIAEHIKWNAPAFYYNSEMAAFDAKEYKRDLVVYNVRKNDYILLIFPTGNVISDASGLLEGSYEDGRRMVTIKNVEDLSAKKEQLQSIIKQWIDKVEK